MQAPASHTVITPAAERDLPALSALWQEMMDLHEKRDSHFTLASDGRQRWEHMAGEMVAREDGFLFKAELEARPVGFCLGWIAQNPPIYLATRVGFISEIAVAQAARRRGIGRELVRVAQRWMRGQGLDEVQLSTAVWNQEARHFWESLGGEPLLIRYRFPA